MKAVVLLSGGLDSTLVTTMAVRECESVHPISFYYGQKHAVELGSAVAVASFFRLTLKYQEIADVFEGSNSALVDDVEIPDISYDEIVGVSPTYVPFRNGSFISLASAYAMTVGADVVMIGAHAEDARGWAYPDCSPEFIGAMTAAVYIGTYGKVRLVAPLLTMTKADIVRKSDEVGSPMHLTRSCYKKEDIACGTCPTCQSRLAAFEVAGLTDPIPYQGR